MHPVVEHIETALRTAGTGSGRILVAVSGGADSMGLLRGVLELRRHLGLQVWAAHLNHRLRGAAAGDDARWLSEMAGSLDVPLILEEADVARLADETGDGIEETARNVRYQFLIRAARDCGADLVATAHNSGDQAETILHHVLRGTGLAGLRGIPHLRTLDAGISLVRPLLSVTRAMIEDYLASLGQPFRIDATNADCRLTRNRIRHELLPLLEADYNGNVQGALLRLAWQAGEAQDALDQLARQQLETAVVSQTATECSLRSDPLSVLPRHLLRVLFCELWQRLGWPRQNMGQSQWEQLASLVTHGGVANLPGPVDARRQGGLLILRKRG